MSLIREYTVLNELILIGSFYVLYYAYIHECYINACVSYNYHKGFHINLLSNGDDTSYPDTK